MWADFIADLTAELTKSTDENAKAYLQNYTEFLNLKRKDEKKLAADRHCQVYFLNKDTDSVDKLTVKRLPLEAMIENGTFILTQKQRNENSRAWRKEFF